jgi:hypothetical protein
MPTSQRKLDSARANGAKSTGPKTAAGKAAAARNAVTHGLAAQSIVLDTESADEYQTELDQYLAHFQPQGKPERDLVLQLAAVHWRLGRYAAVECAILENQMNDDEQWIEKRYETISDIHRLAYAFDHKAGANSSLALLNRYQSRLHREYQKLLTALAEMQSARKAENVKLQNKPNPISEHSAAPLLAVIATQPQTPPAAESAAPKINQPAPPASSALHVRSAWDSHQTSAPAFGCSPRIAASPPPPS